MRIFVSYRRNDSQHTTYRIADRLRAAYGRENVFIDVENLQAGTDFRLAIKTEIERCDVVLVVIGPTWTHNLAGSTIADATDWVHIEVETALDAKVRTIPVLVEGAAMPTAQTLPADLANLAYLNAATIGEGRDFHPHVDWLIESMSPKTGFLAGLRRVTAANLSATRLVILGLVMVNGVIFTMLYADRHPPAHEASGGAAHKSELDDTLATDHSATPASMTTAAIPPAAEIATPSAVAAAPAIPDPPPPSPPEARRPVEPAAAPKTCTVDGLNPNGDNWLALRNSPNFQSSWSATHMGPGTRVMILDSDGDWRRIQLLDGETGWANGRFIRCDDGSTPYQPRPIPAAVPAAPPPPSSSSGTCAVEGLDANGDNWLALRNRPSKSSSWSTTHMGPGTQVTILDSQGEWRHVRLPSGEEGWASGHFIRCD